MSPRSAMPSRTTLLAPAPGEAVFRVTFWSADWTPWRALAQLAARWPTLRFALRPSYDAA